jgi:hypothetical protein
MQQEWATSPHDRGSLSSAALLGWKGKIERSHRQKWGRWVESKRGGVDSKVATLVLTQRRGLRLYWCHRSCLGWKNKYKNTINQPSKIELSARVVDDIIHVLALVLKCQGALTPLSGLCPSLTRTSSWQVIICRVSDNLIGQFFINMMLNLWQRVKYGKYIVWCDVYYLSLCL